MVLHTFTGFFILLPQLELSKKVQALFGLKLSEVHLTNSQSVLLPTMGFEYVKGFAHQSIWDPFRT